MVLPFALALAGRALAHGGAESGTLVLAGGWLEVPSALGGAGHGTSAFWRWSRHAWAAALDMAQAALGTGLGTPGTWRFRAAGLRLGPGLGIAVLLRPAGAGSTG